MNMLNILFTLSEDEPAQLEELEIALSLHDLTVFPCRILDYLDSSSALARAHLTDIGREVSSEHTALMIEKLPQAFCQPGPFRKAN